MQVSRLLSFFLAAGLFMAGVATAQPARDVNLERPCSFVVKTGGGSHTVPAMCPNNYGGPWVIEAVSCWSTTGEMTVLPKLHGGALTSVLPEPLQCGNRARKGIKARGNPTLQLLNEDAATCRTEPCDLDVIVTAPEGLGDHEALVTIVGRLVVGAK